MGFPPRSHTSDVSAHVTDHTTSCPTTEHDASGGFFLQGDYDTYGLKSQCKKNDHYTLVDRASWRRRRYQLLVEASHSVVFGQQWTETVVWVGGLKLIWP